MPPIGTHDGQIGSYRRHGRHGRRRLIAPHKTPRRRGSVWWLPMLAGWSWLWLWSWSWLWSRRVGAHWQPLRGSPPVVGKTAVHGVGGRSGGEARSVGLALGVSKGSEVAAIVAGLAVTVIDTVDVAVAVVNLDVLDYSYSPRQPVPDDSNFFLRQFLRRGFFRDQLLECFVVVLVIATATRSSSNSSICIDTRFFFFFSNTNTTQLHLPVSKTVGVVGIHNQREPKQHNKC
mmetsp:Transcript_726/g.1367  ORF Transcript_726/g.1367 Transcript_726/m.1367 type:complete len:232 (+) Transcript_726:978-1673(+)